MKKALLFFSLLAYASVGFAQQVPRKCDVEATDEYAQAFYKMTPEQRYGVHGVDVIDSVYMIPVKVHIVGRDDSTGFFRTSEAIKNICNLNSRYVPVGFRFYISGPINYIRNSTYYNLPSKTIGDNMLAFYNVPGVINVYYVDLSTLGLCGYAYFPNTGPGGSANRRGGAVLGINGSCSSSSLPGVPDGNTTFAHELGHYFSLMHPFQGTSDNPAGASAERVIRVTTPGKLYGPNCSTSGDGFCDTEADFIDTRWSCPYNGNQKDINQDFFTPDASLYMGYANDVCTNRFSDQQISRMRQTIRTTRNYLLPNRPTIQDTITVAPNTLSPTNSTTPAEYANWCRFTWNAVPGATMYHLRIAQFVTFSTILFDTIVSDTSFIYTYQLTGRFQARTRLQPNRSYFWSVQALNETNLCGPYSPGVNFTTNAVLGNDNIVTPIANCYPTVLEQAQTMNIDLAVATNNVIIETIDITGKLIQSKQIANQGNTLISSFDPGVKTPGMYFLRINTAGKYSTVKFIVK